jgi:hypothetical protein
VYSESLFDTEDDHITDSVVLIFSMKKSTDVLLFDCCRDFEIRDFRFLQLSRGDSSETFDFQSTDCIYLP